MRVGTGSGFPLAGGLVLAGLAASLALSACSSGGSGPAAPSSAAVPTIVGDPLNLTMAAARPCTLLRPDQLAQYRLGNPGAATAIDLGAGPTAGCAWRPVDAGQPSFTVGVDLRSGGLAGLYRRRAAFALFRPTKISEYPAVHTATLATSGTKGACSVQVGVAGDTLLMATVTIPDPRSLDYTDPCPSVDAFAATVIANAEGNAP